MPPRNDRTRRAERAEAAANVLRAREALTDGLTDWLYADRVTADEWLLLLKPDACFPENKEFADYLRLIRKELAADHGHWLNELTIAAKVRLGPDSGDHYVVVSDADGSYPVFFAGERLDPYSTTGVPHDFVPWDCDDLETWVPTSHQPRSS